MVLLDGADDLADTAHDVQPVAENRRRGAQRRTLAIQVVGS
jgi:hypothetical protein